MSGKRTMQKEFQEASLRLTSSNSFERITQDTIENIKYLTNSFYKIFDVKTFNSYIYINNLNLVDIYFKDTLNKIISNILDKSSILDEQNNDLTKDFIYSIILLISIDGFKRYPEIAKTIRNIFFNYENYNYFNPKKNKKRENNITFWQFNNVYCSQFIQYPEPIFKVGDKVDVLIETSNKEEINTMVWMEGIIKKVENNLYYILYNGEDETNDEICYPVGFPTVRKRSDDWDWRLNLKKNEKIYAYYRESWIHSTIIDIEESEKNGIKKIKYKVKFNEDSDDNNSNEKTWYQDEMFLYHFSRSLQREVRNKKNEIPIKREIIEEQNKIEQEINGMILYKKENRTNIVIGKFGKFDYNYAKLLKKMEKYNLLNNFLNILKSDYNFDTTFDIVYTIYTIFNSSLDYLHPDFIKEKKDLFRKGYFKLFEIENIDYNYLVNIKKFLKKIWDLTNDSFDDIENEIKEKIMGNFYNLVNSNELEMRIKGFKDLNKKIMFNDKIDLAQELKNFDIIDKIFGTGYHPEIVKYSENILQFMKNFKMIDKRDIKIIWGCTKKDNADTQKENKNILIKILEKLIVNSDENFFEMLIDEIIEDKRIPDNIERQFIKKLSYETENYKFKICEYYFNILIESNDLNISNNFFAENIRDLTLNNPNLYYGLFMLYKEKIERNINSLLCYELLIDLFQSSISINYKKHPPFYINNTYLSDYLSDADKPLIRSFENDFRKYFEETKRIADINNIDKINHENNIKIRLNFLYELTRIYPEYDFIPLMKSFLIDEPIFPEDNKYFLDFLEKYCSYDNNDINIYNQKRNKILLDLFDEIIPNDDDDFDKIYSLEEIKILIRLLYYKYYMYFDLNITKINNNEDYEINFKSGKNKKEIESDIFDIFWNLLFKVKEEKLIKIIMNIFLQILRDEKKIIYRINDQLNELDYQDEHDIKIIKKCYEILKIFFIESEKNLTIKIKPHYSLLKDCIIKFPLEIENEEKKSEFSKIECFYGNSSLNEVKEILVSKYRVNIEYIDAYIKQNGKDIFLDYSYNHKSLNKILEEFNILKNEITNSFKNPMNSYLYFLVKEKKELIKDNELSPELKNLLEILFYKATKGNEEMEPRHFKNFMNTNIKSYFKELHIRDPKKEYLTKEDIYKYYFQKITQDEKGKEEFLKDLKNSGYNEYFKNQSKSLVREQTENIYLFRYYLSVVKEGQNNFLEDFIFNYNNINPKIDYDLFFFLPTSEYYYEQFLQHDKKLFVELNRILQDENEILKQLYYLIIMESFLQDIETQYIELKDIFSDQNMLEFDLCSHDYLPFDKKENFDKKIQFFEQFINEKNNHPNLIEYANNLMNNKKFESDELSQKCLIKSLKIIKILYLSLIEIKEEKIISEASKEKNIYYFHYTKINEVFQNKVINKNPNLSYSKLLQNIFNYIISNFNNENNRNESLFEECLDLFIIIVSSNENYFNEICNKDNKNFSDFSDFIKGKIISNTTFILEKLLLSLNYVTKDASESQYIQFLYDIIYSIFSMMLNGDVKNQINSEEYFEFFIEFNKFIYNDKNYQKDDQIKKIMEILINDSNNLNNRILSEELFIKYLSIFNNHFLKIVPIRKLFFHRLREDLSLISSLYHNIFKKISNKRAIQQSRMKDNQNLILLEENNTKEILFENDLINISRNFILNCLDIEKIDQNSLKDIMYINNDLLYLNIPKGKKEEGVVYKNSDIQLKNAGFVGLKNLSSTCYLNSVLQQLFMIHVLKYAILGITNISIYNNILNQMQILFANLKLSEKRYYEPINLCRTKIFNNEPINVKIQQDSKEFYDSVCDSLENCLKDTKYKYIISDALMGCMSHSIKCESCGYTSNNFENFCDLSLEIKDINTLKQSLLKLNQEERVSDSLCDNCNSKDTILLRITLSKLPNTLFLHLKRFSYENGINRKIFSEFKFNSELNLKQYCTEAFQKETDDIYQKKDEYYLYELKGVVQHSGNAYGGHYVSFIDVNREGIGNTMNQRNDKGKNSWIEFNDSNVSEFNPGQLKKETFGNNDDKTAYLLIYERKKKSPIKIVIKNFKLKDRNQKIINFKEEEINKINKEYDIYNKNSTLKEEDLYNTIFYNETKNEYFKYIPYYSIRKEIPEKLYNEIMEENLNLGKGVNYSNNLISPNEKFSEDFEKLLFSSIDSEDALNNALQMDINDKYDYVKIIFYILFKKIKSENINSKLKNVNRIINEIILSKVNPDINKVIQLSNLLITEKILKIIFTNGKSHIKEVFNQDNFVTFQKLIFCIIKKISLLRNEYQEAEKEDIRIAKVLVNYYINLEREKSEDKFFNKFLLEIIEKDEKILGILLEYNFINIALNNLENNKKLKIFDIIKTIIKTTKDYYNKDLFYYEENDQIYNLIKERPKIKIEHIRILRERMFKGNPSLLQMLFIYDYELLTILSKILCYQYDTKDQYSIKFILEYYKLCRSFLQEENNRNIIEYYSLYFNLIDIKDENALAKMRILLGYPRLIIKPENKMNNYEGDEVYFYGNIRSTELDKEIAENLSLREEIDKEILENEMNMNLIGEQLIKNNEGDIQTYIYDYNITHILDGKIIGFLAEVFCHDYFLGAETKNELIYRLIDKCFYGFGNFNIFKYLYTLPARSLYYNNVFEELMAQLDSWNKKKLEYSHNIKDYFISRIKGIPYPNIPQKYIDYNPDIKPILNFQGYNPDYIPGNVIKKEIQIVKQTDYIELIRIEYFTNFYSIEDIKNIYNNANYFPEDQINNENIKGFIDLEKDAESEVDDFCLLDDEGKKIKYYQINDDIIKRFKKGEKITIRFNDNETKEEEIKTIISYIIVNKKPFCNKYSFNIRFRQQIQEKKDNSFMVDSLRSNYILDRSYKVITIIQRKSLDSKFFDSDDIYGELKTSYISSDELSSFFAYKINFSDSSNN